jgi:hypothetical protein
VASSEKAPLPRQVFLWTLSVFLPRNDAGQEPDGWLVCGRAFVTRPPSMTGFCEVGIRLLLPIIATPGAFRRQHQAGPYPGPVWGRDCAFPRWATGVPHHASAGVRRASGSSQDVPRSGTTCGTRSGRPPRGVPDRPDQNPPGGASAAGRRPTLSGFGKWRVAGPARRPVFAEPFIG